MQYIERMMERKFLRMSDFFQAVLLTGARQVGKTTMLKHLAEGQGRTYVSLDDTMVRALAQSDPALFFQKYRPPVIIDEIQKAPELFEQIKLLCDAGEERGLFWLTGSQQFGMMKEVRETLAGRIGILEMHSLSKSEEDGVRFPCELDFSMECFEKRQPYAKKNNIVDVFEHIWRGGMPGALHADAEQRQEYFYSYMETYLMRDIVEQGNVTDTVRFRKFINACAALVGEPVNYKTLAEAAEISQPTAKAWLWLLQGLGIVYLLLPYASGRLKRLSQTPKLYFYDTGLCAYLSMWPTRDCLMNGAAAARFFENHVVIELLKSFACSPSKVRLTYYRDSNAKEIDLFVEESHCIHPLEIRMAANPDRREVKKFDLLDDAEGGRGCGGIVCLCENAVPIDERDSFIPCSLI